jgi:hypothetical protein
LAGVAALGVYVVSTHVLPSRASGMAVREAEAASSILGLLKRS